MCNAVAHRSYRGILSAFATVEIVKTCKNAPLMRYFNMYFLVMTANALKYKCTLVRSSCRSGFYRVETGISVVWFDSGIWISGSSSSQFVTQVCFFSNEKFVSRKIETRFWFQKNPNVGWNHICVCLKKYKPAWGNCFYVWLFTNAVGNQDKVSRKAKLGLERAARLEVHLKLHESLNNYGVKLKDGLRTSLRTRPTISVVDCVAPDDKLSLGELWGGCHVRILVHWRNTTARTPARSRFCVNTAVLRLPVWVIWILTFVVFTRGWSYLNAIAMNLSLKSGIGKFTLANTRTNSTIAWWKNISRGREPSRERESREKRDREIEKERGCIVNLSSCLIYTHT